MKEDKKRKVVLTMQRRRLRKLRWLREGCMTSGVIGFFLLASIPDNMPGRMILERAVIALLVMALSWITYQYAQCMERRYIRIHKRQQAKKKSA